MTTIMTIMKHYPKDCPALSESAKKLTLEFGSKSGELYKKHGIKRVAGWVSCTPPEHIAVTIFDAPTIEAFVQFQMEPVVAKWLAAQDKVEYKIAMTTEEGMKIVQASK
jgi:hypothetical protein